jgi:hypothetical protein
MAYIMAQNDDALRTCAITDRTAYFFYAPEPFVVKSGEIVVKRLERGHLDTGWQPLNDAHYVAAQWYDDFFKIGDTVATCVELTIVTPDSTKKSVIVPLFKFVMIPTKEPGEGSRAISIDVMSDFENPARLLR